MNYDFTIKLDIWEHYCSWLKKEWTAKDFKRITNKKLKLSSQIIEDKIWVKLQDESGLYDDRPCFVWMEHRFEEYPGISVKNEVYCYLTLGQIKKIDEFINDCAKKLKPNLPLWIYFQKINNELVIFTLNFNSLRPAYNLTHSMHRKLILKVSMTDKKKENK